MGDILRWPSFMTRRRREHPVDDVSAVFCECCSALNSLTPKSREMVARWLQERYAAQLEEDMVAAAEAAQSARDEVYVERITGGRR